MLTSVVMHMGPPIQARLPKRCRFVMLAVSPPRDGAGVRSRNSRGARAPSRAALRLRCEGSRLKLASASRPTNRGLLGSRRILTGPTGLAVWVREHGLTDSAAPGSRSDSAWSQQDADALCLASDAIGHLNVRQLLALQFAKKGEALCADPRNRRKFGRMRPLQILDSEEARVGQSSRTSEGQSSALPSLGRQPVLFKGRRFASSAVRQLCPQPLTSSRFTPATRSQDYHQPHLRCKFIILQLRATGTGIFVKRGASLSHRSAVRALYKWRKLLRIGSFAMGVTAFTRSGLLVCAAAASSKSKRWILESVSTDLRIAWKS